MTKEKETNISETREKETNYSMDFFFFNGEIVIKWYMVKALLKMFGSTLLFIILHFFRSYFLFNKFY